MGADAPGRERLSRHIELLQSLAERAEGRDSLFELLREAVAELCEELGWDAGCIRILRDGAGLYAGDEAWYLRRPEAAAGAGPRLPQPSGALLEAIQRGGELVLLGPEPAERAGPGAGDTEVSWVCGFPITIGSRLWAVGELQGGLAAKRDEAARALLSQVGLQLGQVVERVEAEHQLRLREAYYRSLIERAFDLVLVLDEDGSLRYASPSAQRVLGLEGQRLLGRSLLELLPSAERERWHGLLSGAAGDGPLQLRLELERGQRGPRVLEVELRRMLHEPAVAGIVLVARDISRRIEAERALRAARRQLADRAEEERLFLAQELHDGPVQVLSGAIYGLGNLADGLQDLPSATRAARIERDLRQVIVQLRRICQSLRPTTLMTFGLRAALRSEAEGFGARHPELTIALDLDDEAGPRLGRAQRLALFRIAQQALTNIARHAEARQVELRLRVDAERFTLELRDDGRGFEPPEDLAALAGRGSLGLLGMKERAEAIDARFELRSAPGRGTELRVSGPTVEEEEGR